MGWDYSLSASKLNLMTECKRCFFDANILKIERPRGIFPSLPGGVDRVMKTYLDQHRGALPPSLAGKIPGVLWGDVAQITKLRHWKSGLKAVVSIGKKTVSLIGALDDLIQEFEGTFSPFDTKTKGDVPKDDGAQYYQGQLDIYALLLRENKMPPSGKGYLDYHYPVQTAGNTITFDHVLYQLTADADRAVAWIAEAVGVLTGGQPDSNPACEFCQFAQPRVTAALKVVTV